MIDEFLEKGHFVKIVDHFSAGSFESESEYRLYCEAIYRSAGFEAASRVLQQGLKSFPDSPDLHHAWAELSVMEGRDPPSNLSLVVNEAATTYIHAIHKWLVGEKLDSEQMLERALGSADTVLRRKIVTRLVRQYITDERFAEAERTVVIELERGKTWFGHWLMALLHVSRNEPTAAIESVLKAREHPRGSDNMHVDDVDSIAQFMVGNFARSVELLEAITQQWPMDQGSWYWLARGRAKLRLFESAESAVQRSLAIKQDLRGLRLLTLLQARRGHFRAAYQSFKRFMRFER